MSDTATLTKHLLDPRRTTRIDGVASTPDSPATVLHQVEIDGGPVQFFTNEFWTSRQRQASSLHEVSYRACFKPQLPRFFIKVLTQPGDLVYDPFSGRGTTAVEAALLGRRVAANDINPLSEILAAPRLRPPKPEEVGRRLAGLPLEKGAKAGLDLSMFYDARTESEIVSLKDYLQRRRAASSEDSVDQWIRMVATNRLTGHSPGFFSVYTLPPNQAVAPDSQIKINAKLGQVPEYRDTKAIILRKSRQLLGDVKRGDRENLLKVAETAAFTSVDARSTPQIGAGTVQLTVTSPPFLDVVQYSGDNWLRCWFNSIDDRAIAKRITMSKTVAEWSCVMQSVFDELFRITKPGGWVAFEVGEVRNGKIRLEEHVIPLGRRSGFQCAGVLINAQTFTKTSNIWGVSNNRRGTNTNRVVMFQKP